MEGNAQAFMDVTGASEQVAKEFIKNAKGDVDLAVAMYLSSQEGEEEGAGGSPGGAPAEAQAPSGSEGLVTDILDGVKARGDPGGDTGGEAGKGSGKGGSRPERNVIIVFFSDGFMVDEEYEPTKPEPAAEQPAAPAPRRTGMMGLGDLKKDSKARGPMPKLPKLKPLRSYDTPEGKAFLADVKAGRVPQELQQRDEKGAPVPVAIALDDERPKSYEEIAKVLKQLEGMQKETEAEAPSAKASGPALFAGAGQTLSSGSSSSAAAPGATAGSGPGAEPALVAIVSAGPPPKADDSKPVATVQLRLAGGARVTAKLNLEHTVADLWRFVAEKMGMEAFRAASNHQLVAGFPPKPLSDPSITIKDADLANAAVTHRCQ